MNKQVVLITGCSSGVGRNLCIALKKRGYLVIASARNLEKIKDLDTDMKVAIDVTDNISIKKAIGNIISKFGRIDILVNNAGYSIRSSVEDIDLDKIHQMFNVNVYGMIRMIKIVAPYMRTNHYGRIINIGSISGKITSIVNGGYCASKHAVEAISEAARYELKDFGIEVSVLEPGAMDTEFFNTLSKNSDSRMKNCQSIYNSFYQRDLNYRKRQKRADVKKSVDSICRIINKKRLKARYKISVPFYFSILCHLPDAIKEKLIIKFS